LAAVALAVASAGLWGAPRAVAAPLEVNTLRAALEAARTGSSCGPFRSDPVVQHVAEVINKSLNDWLDHTATRVPIEDPLPGLKELGYHGSKGVMVGGASSESQAEAIKGVLLEGYDKIPDCSYTDVGVSILFNADSGQNLAAVVFAGP
jgi:hypothetical protein